MTARDNSFWQKVVIGYAVVVVALIIFGNNTITFVDDLEAGKLLSFLNTISVGWSLSWIVLVHFLLSWRQVDTEERGLITFFGKPIRGVEYGLVFVPWLLFQLRKAKRTVQQIELPGEPEKVWRKKEIVGGEEFPAPITPEAIAAGWVEPIRVPFNDSDPVVDDDSAINKDPVHQPGGLRKIVKANLSIPDEEKDLLTRRLTVEVPIVLRFQILDFETFLTTIGASDDSFDEAIKQLSDMVVAETVAALEIGTIARAQANRNAISDYITEKVTASTAGWGIEIKPIRLKQFIISRKLSLALQSISEARAKAENMRTLAASEKQKLIDIGDGNASAVQANLNALAEGYKKIAADTGCTGAAIVASETAKEVSKKVETLNCFGSDGMSDLLRLVTAGSTVVRAQGRQPKTRGAAANPATPPVPGVNPPAAGATPPAPTNP